ncbi:MAG: hypothetical protein Q9M18_04340 [Mariprofundaceae bacterium]|nr:hypothetical protein [Mariprofundaceae bacterium]
MMMYVEVLKICDRHAERLQWAMHEMQGRLPFDAHVLGELSGIELAILDQFTARFSKLQDMMGAKLFPVILELTKEQGELSGFIDKLNRLEKNGVIASAHDWLILAEMRNSFSHEYPDEPEIQASLLNKSFVLANELLATLDDVKSYANRYVSEG